MEEENDVGWGPARYITAKRPPLLDLFDIQPPIYEELCLDADGPESMEVLGVI